MSDYINFLLSRFESRLTSTAIIHRDNPVTYQQLLKSYEGCCLWLNKQSIPSGAVVILRGDYSVLSISMLLALVNKCCIVVPLTTSSYCNVANQLDEVAPQFLIDVTGEGQATLQALGIETYPSLYSILREKKVPGLVLFTSGSSGKPKAVVHDFSKLLLKFHRVRVGMTTLNFLLFDHWGGLNTLLHGLATLSLIVIPDKRTPEYICSLIENYEIELLPVTPSFINSLIISKAYKRYNLSSLKLITYGAEIMPEQVLLSLRKNFPRVDLRQTYGMIELGVLGVKSKSVDSLWIKLGGEGNLIRVVDGILQIRAQSAMLGYLNECSAFTEDGYLITGDLVEVDGEWIRVLGRQSDIINVGGQKVYPAEVESVLLQSDMVDDAVVYGENNALMGKIVCAEVVLASGVDKKQSKVLLSKHCAKNLQSYMIPVKFYFVEVIRQSTRLKKVRLPS